MGDAWRGRVLHLHDAAHTAENLVRAARRAGLPWSRMDLPWFYRRELGGPAGFVIRKVRRAGWDGYLALRGQLVDVMHVHTGTLAEHARFVRTPYVVHLHGTDIRTRAYEPAWERRITGAVEAAAAVVYASPDLAEHTHRLRADATYLPQPVDVSTLPRWSPRPRIVFASRWESVKGSAAQLEVARRITARAPGTEVVGIDWGPDAAAAAAAGVRLYPKLPHAQFLELLASASVVVGQMSGILAVSELEALGIGVPVVGGYRREWYPRLSALGGPESEAVAAAALAALADASGAAAEQDGRAFVLAEHDAAVGVRRLQRLYAPL